MFAFERAIFNFFFYYFLILWKCSDILFWLEIKFQNSLWPNRVNSKIQTSQPSLTDSQLSLYIILYLVSFSSRVSKWIPLGRVVLDSVDTLNLDHQHFWYKEPLKEFSTIMEAEAHLCLWDVCDCHPIELITQTRC